MKCLLLVAALSIGAPFAADLASSASPYDYVDSEALRIEQQAVRSLADFKTSEGRARRGAELLDMFGLSPAPDRGDLHATITGRLEDETVVVEKIHFQSSPHLYVTANLWLPKKIEAPLPAVLYVCGHSEVKTNGVSCGNKTAYQHHGAWFARNGYACLVIDTVQLGEIPGLHHGTYREGMWWWNSRGYSPAAVEAWNCIRALDYLETRPEIDKTRFAITGRSGGGAYSWFATALDSRIKVAAPVAGITDPNVGRLRRAASAAAGEFRQRLHFPAGWRNSHLQQTRGHLPILWQHQRPWTRHRPRTPQRHAGPPDSCLPLVQPLSARS